MEKITKSCFITFETNIVKMVIEKEIRIGSFVSHKFSFKISLLRHFSVYYSLSGQSLRFEAKKQQLIFTLSVY